MNAWKKAAQQKNNQCAVLKKVGQWSDTLIAENKKNQYLILPLGLSLDVQNNNASCLSIVDRSHTFQQ